MMGDRFFGGGDRFLGGGDTANNTSSSIPSSIYLDEMTKKFRLVHPDDHHMAQQVAELCEDILGDGEDFLRYVAEISDLMDKMADLVYEAKMELIGKRCQRVIVANERYAEENCIQEEIIEKMAQVERNQLYHESLVRQKHEQTEALNRILRK